MKKAIKTVCVAGGALFGLYTIFYAGMAVGIGYGLTSDKDGWSQRMPRRQKILLRHITPHAGWYMLENSLA